MKLIHCADLHLDSRMESGLPAEKAGERRLELLHTFTKMVETAAEDGTEAILMCGDLFDAGQVSARARRCVLDTVRMHPQICFYYLKGNHDKENLFKEKEQIPENLYLFGENWKTYEQGTVRITGAELNAGNETMLAETLHLDEQFINIVMLHGMASEYGGGTDGIALRNFRGKGIDYLALGHVHSCQIERLDERSTWAYSGCLEGRGFDECGEKGYIRLQTEAGHVSAQFVPCSFRTLHEIHVDLSACRTGQEQLVRAEAALSEVPASDLVKLVLTGAICPGETPDVDWMQEKLKRECYHLKIKDQTKLDIRPEDYRYDVSLKGEFVRQVLQAGLPEEEKEEILRFGLQALDGEA